MSDIQLESTTIPARDGYRLAATIFRRGSGKAKRVAIVSSATAVPRRFYANYAAALANAGYVAISYDYRGIGESRPERLRGFDATVRDWALKDMAGVVDWASETFRPDRLFMVGHSVGGQVTGLLDNSERIDAMLTMSAQSGYWGVQGGEQKAVVGFHVYVTLPMLSNLLGYMPWSWVGSAEDLPKGAAIEWSRWCRHPDYLLGDATLPLERYQEFTAPVLAYSIDDDKWGTSRSVDRMMSAYPNVERRHLEPASVGLPSLGHFGYFRKPASAAWEEGIAWLDDF